MSQTNQTSLGTHAEPSLPDAARKSFWTISRKLLFPSVAVMTVLALGLIIYIATFTVQRNQAETARNLTQTAGAVESNIQGLQNLALGLATEMANSPQVQAAFAAQDRQLLTEIALPTFEVVQKDFEVKQYQFILPPATSFLRLHQIDSYGDDLSAFRFTVLAADSTQKPVSGIEIGRGGLGVRGEVPVFFEGKYIGVVDTGLDIGPAYLEKLKQQYGVDVQILLEKKAAQTAIFQGATSETSGPTPDLLIQASTFAEPLYADPTAYDKVLKGETVVSQLTSQGKTYAVLSAPLKDYSGAVIGVLEISLDRTEIIAAQYQSLVISILLSLLATFLGGFILVQFINYTLRPVKALTETAALLAGGDLGRQVVVQSKDELGILASAFNNMTSRLRDLIGTLEERVAERTKSLELAVEVGRSVSQVRALDIMLKDAAEIIRSRFDLYYVQVYLTDPSQTNLILQSGTGTVGAELAGRAHQLPLSTASINGRAAIEKRSVVISDTTASATFKPNPLLPDTRSEMAVPLIIGEKVVGVLDLQSNKAGSLSQDILPAFEALAGQLAIAIQNASLLAETEQARAEVEAQARRLVRAGWQDYLDAIHKPEQIGFMFQGDQVTSLTEAEQPELVSGGDTLAAPISVSGEKLGALVVEMEEQKRSPQMEQLIFAVARQVAQQIESLRLLDSAERYRAEAEQASRRLTREGWKDYTAANAAKGLSYIYDLKEVRSLNLAGDHQVEDSDFSLPLKVRDEAVGKLSVLGLKSDDQESLDLVTAVAERLGAHIEGLRLSQQTEQVARREHALRQITSAVRGSTDPATILRAAVRELGTLLGRKTVIRLATSDQTRQPDSAAISGDETVSLAGSPNAVGGDE